MQAVKGRAQSGIQGMFLDDAFKTDMRAVLAPGLPGDSEMSTAAQKAIPVVATGMGAAVGGSFGGKWGAVIGADIGAHAGAWAEHEIQKLPNGKHLKSTPTNTNHAVPPPIGPTQPATPTTTNYYIYGGKGAGVPRYPHEPVIHPKRGRSRKTHRRKTSR